MYAVINNNVIVGFETRSQPLEELVHEGLRHLYIDISEYTEVELDVGDLWNSNTNTWIKGVPRAEESLVNYPASTTLGDLLAELEVMKAGMKATGVIPKDFVQPTGAHDAYVKGTKVVYQGQIWESKIDANVWSPTDYPQGWKLV